MAETLAEHLVEFALRTRFEELPPEVVAEARRRLIDSFWCAIGALKEPAPSMLMTSRQGCAARDPARASLTAPA